jgi:hypothetical protein
VDKQQQQQQQQQQQNKQLLEQPQQVNPAAAAPPPAAAAAVAGYEAVAGAAFGRLGRLLVSGVMYAELLGICCVYIVLEVRGSVHTVLLPHAPREAPSRGVHGSGMSHVTVTVLEVWVPMHLCSACVSVGRVYIVLVTITITAIGPAKQSNPQVYYLHHQG